MDNNNGNNDINNILPVKFTGVRLLQECIAFDLIITNKLYSFIPLCRSPSQFQHNLGHFLMTSK